MCTGTSCPNHLSLNHAADRFNQHNRHTAVISNTSNRRRRLAAKHQLPVSNVDSHIIALNF